MLKSTAAAASDTDAHQTLWPACLQALARELPAQQFRTWIEPLQAQSSADGATLTLLVANRFKLDCIRTQYAGQISKVLEGLSETPVQLELAIAPRQRHAHARPARRAPGSDTPSVAALPARASRAADRRAPDEHRHRLNTALTFETFVEGSANRMARAAALHVAGAPGELYNPLFIYGGVGLGKTHLMHAIGNRLLRDRTDARILYIHAEQFVSDVVKAYQHKTFDKFKAYYRSLDLLLIDDVQFFANKERTQEEFFNAFEALLARKSHMVMTSDTYPKGLTNIHERLVSRFDAGLTVAIEPPELEMRVAILISKARAVGSVMPEEVAFFIAKNVRSNVRELEGALRKVLAFARFNQRDISIVTSREALRDLLSIQNRLISVESIQKTVADYYKIKVSDMYSRRRPASIARPRQIAMYLAKELTQKSLPEIGDLFGGRDHTTVLHAVRKIGSERQQLTELNQQLHVLEQTLKG
ncbi:MAG: chromosomal replication initiator protein DnaA [Ottowia sp.]|nr:chromosomal replication initiator protein DnaA [Ottowia sp.]